MCTTGTVKADTAMSLARLVGAHPREIGLSILHIEGCYVSLSRNMAARLALKSEEKFTHLFFLDSDVTVQADALVKLLGHQKPIVAAMYNRRMLPAAPPVWVGDEKSARLIKPGEVPDSLFKCYAVPAGVLLIDLTVFGKIAKPWFLVDIRPDDTHTGEDIWFCKQAHRAGFDVWCDPTIPVQHIGDYPY